MENPDDQFSLKWNNFQSNLATGFHDLLQEEDMVDVTLAAEGKYLQAHKVILSVCSPYFKDLFKANPCKHPIVILKDVGHQELSDMLDFMYRGEASVRQEDLSAFLKLAETLKVKGLAGDRTVDEAPSPFVQQAVRKVIPVVKKKRVVEAAVFEPEDDPGDPEFGPSPGEPRRKRKRVPSPTTKTDSSATSAGNSFVPLANPKQELTESEEVEFLDEGAPDALADYIQKTNEDSTLELPGGVGDESREDGEGAAGAGPSGADDSMDQVPQGTFARTYGKRSHPIWDYFTRDQANNLAICNLCGKFLTFATSTSVGNLINHLAGKRSNHQREYQEFCEKKRSMDDQFRISVESILKCDVSTSEPGHSSDTYYYIENQHGLPQLVHDGYVFRRDRERMRQAMTIQGVKVQRVRTYWRCIFRKCRARGNVDPSGYLHLSHMHNHPRNEESVKYRNLRTEIKKRALEYKHESPQRVLEHFNIRDLSLEKTIINWRYRYVREPRTTEDDYNKFVCKTEPDGQIYTAVKDDDMVLTDTCRMFEVEASDTDQGPKVYYIIEDE